MKKAIVVVSFGTTYLEALRNNIESTEVLMREAFPGFEVRRAFTSRLVIKRLAERDGIQIDNEQQALERLRAEGYQLVYVQPLHVVAGEEYEKVREMVASYAHAGVFEKIAISRPLLYYTGQKGKPDDYGIAIEALRRRLPIKGSHDAIVLMGHGGTHPANTAYAALQLKLEEAGLERVFVYAVEGFPSLESVIRKLLAQQVKTVTLMPFMLVAGNHAVKDMAGEKENSAKMQLLAAGFEVDILLCGLGENAAVRDIYVQHVRECHMYP